MKLPMTGVRRKGYFSSLSTSKPAMSVSFDEFVDKKIDGIDRIALNNVRQDSTFLREHLGYEVCRLAGLPAPRTAHAIVTVNVAGTAPRELGRFAAPGRTSIHALMPAHPVPRRRGTR